MAAYHQAQESVFPGNQSSNHTADLIRYVLRKLDKSPLNSALQKLRPLLFDNAKNPLFFKRMATAWRTFTARPLEPAGENFLSRVNAVCSNTSFYEEEMIFAMYFKKNLTPAGAKKIQSFVQANPKRYKINQIPNGIKFIRKKTTMKEIRANLRDHLQAHARADKQLSHMYPNAQETDPTCVSFTKFIDENRMKSDIQFCQQFEWNHSYKDANIRTAIFWLNRMLNEKGQTYTLVDDPNILDGYTVDEIYDELKKGQQRFLALEGAELPPSVVH